MRADGASAILEGTMDLEIFGLPSLGSHRAGGEMSEPVTDLDHARYDRDGWMESALKAQTRVAKLEAAVARLEAEVVRLRKGVEEHRQEARVQAALLAATSARES